jgi:23S rRNA pseudouridine1911/1915/1917 synthase
LFVEAQPKTGRTHQIRVHARYIQHPVIADPLYATRKEKLLGFKRLALHAYKIAFTDMEGFSKEYIAQYPADFEHALKLCTDNLQ